jgi:hypothetical protein
MSDYAGLKLSTVLQIVDMVGRKVKIRIHGQANNVQRTNKHNRGTSSCKHRDRTKTVEVYHHIHTNTNTNSMHCVLESRNGQQRFSCLSRSFAYPICFFTTIDNTSIMTTKFNLTHERNGNCVTASIFFRLKCTI